MADSFIRLPEDGLGKKTRTIQETVGANAVHSQVIRVSDDGGTVFTPAKDDTLTDGSQVSQGVGDVAHDAVDAGNPVKVGGKASTSIPSQVASGDRVNMAFSREGCPVMAGKASTNALLPILVDNDGNIVVVQDSHDALKGSMFVESEEAPGVTVDPADDGGLWGATSGAFVMAGKDGGNARHLLSDGDGHQQIDIQDISKGTQTNDVKVTMDSEVVAVDATGQGDVPITLDSEVVSVDATGQGDVPVTLDGESVGVTGTVTANAGTNLNTSALALESGGNLDDIKTAVEKIDDKEDSITYVEVMKSTTDGDVIATPGAGHHLRVWFIETWNAGVNDTEFELQAGSGGDPIFRRYLAAAGGGAPTALPRPWDLPTNTSLYYDWIAGASADILLTIGYEDITEAK